MFSILGGLLILVLSIYFRLPQRIANELAWSYDGFVQYLASQFDEPHDGAHQSNGSARTSIGPPWDWLSFVRSWLRPTPLARVRVPARRSTR